MTTNNYDTFTNALLHLVEHGVGVDEGAEDALATVRSATPRCILRFAARALAAMTGTDEVAALSHASEEATMYIGNCYERPDAEVPGASGWFALGWLMSARERFKTEGSYRTRPDALERVRAALQDDELREEYTECVALKIDAGSTTTINKLRTAQ